MDDDLQFRRKTFFDVLRNHSEDKEDPVSEWEFAEIVDTEGDTTCICSTPIRYLYKIRNRINRNTLIIGSECIKRWLHGALKCQGCRCTLGNITKRLRTQNFHCRSCKKELEQQFQNRVNSKLGSMRLFWFGPYYQRQFKEVIEDIPYVEKLLNVENKTKTLELFEQYVNHVYDVIEQS